MQELKHRLVILLSMLIGVAVCASMAFATDIRVAVGAQLEGWDPHTSIFFLADEISWNCYDRLLDFETTPASETEYGIEMIDSTKLRGMLAESWELREDGSVIVLHLRKGVIFPSGNSFTAEDVRYSVERKWEIPTANRWLLNVIGITSLDAMEVIDDYTIQFTLDGPNAIFLPAWAFLSSLSIVDSAELKMHATTDDPYGHEYLSVHVVPTGPYTVKNYIPGSEVVLEAYDGYWRGKPKTDRVIYKVVPEEANRVLLLKNGDVDMAYFISAEQVKTQLEGAAGVTVLSIPTAGTEYFNLQTTRKPLYNRLLRQAIAYAVPYDDLIENVMYGYASRATSPIPTLTAYHRDVSPYDYNPAKSRELLALAGYKPGEVTLTLSYRLDNPDEEAIAVYLKDALEDVGINIVIDKVAASSFSEMRAQQDYETSLLYWIPYVNNPIYQLSYSYHSKTGCCNYGRYSNATFDAMLDAAKAEQDPMKVEGLVNAMQDLIIGEVPIVLLYHPNRQITMRDNLTGYVYWTNHLIRYNLMDKE